MLSEYYCGDGQGTGSWLGFKLEFSFYDERLQQVGLTGLGISASL